MSSDVPATLSDTIEPLINCYRQVRDAPEAVALAAQAWPVDSETFYRIRATDFDDPAMRSAQFIYLNKTCFNGLYRENQSGKFNVPFGRPKNDNIIDLELINVASRKLKTDGTRIEVCDFDDSLAHCEAGDVAYLDPPYVAGHRQNGFVDYNAKLFSWEDQRRLASAALSLQKKGVFVIVSNADHPSVRNLFDQVGFSFFEISRYSSMAAHSATRGKSDELLIVSDNLKSRNRV